MATTSIDSISCRNVCFTAEQNGQAYANQVVLAMTTTAMADRNQIIDID
jgi:hypothetical protein